MTPEAVVIESMFRIVNKQGEDVDFKLNEQQRIFDDNIADRNVIPKPRQVGMSSYILARGLARCLGKRNTRAVVISHDAESTQRMLNKVHYMIENMRGPKPVIDRSSKNEITFPKTNSMFYIGTAGSRKFGRGDTITFLHCSEIAFWENAKDLSAGLLQAVPLRGSEVFMESTGNGMGNYYYKMCMRAQASRSRYRLQFFPWNTVSEYQINLTEEEALDVVESLDDEFEEPFLYRQLGLSPGQIQWRRDKLEEMEYDLDLFKQEYPLSLDECFKASGRSIFSKVNYIPSRNWITKAPNLTGLESHPRRGHCYAIGADVGAGIGNDASVAEIVDLDLGEQVAEYVNDKMAPDDFGHKLAHLGIMYNQAFITPESNNHGIVTLNELRDIYPVNKIFRRPKRSARDPIDRITDFGWRTSVKSKPYAIGELRKALCSWLTIHSPILKSQLDAFIETESGQLEAEAGSHDDTVIALAMVAVSFEKAQMNAALDQGIDFNYVDPFSLEGIIDELKRRDEVPAGIPKFHLGNI